MKRKEIKRLSIMLSVMMAVTSLPGQCIMAGEIQGRIHSIAISERERSRRKPWKRDRW